MILSYAASLQHARPYILFISHRLRHFPLFFFSFYNPRDREYLRIAFEISSWRACFDFFPFEFRGQRTWATRDKVNLDGKYTCFTKTYVECVWENFEKTRGIYYKKKKRTNPCEDKIMQDYASKKNSLPLIIEILFFVDFIDHPYEQTWYLNENDSREWSKKIHQSCYFYTLSLIIPYIRIEDKK